MQRFMDGYEGGSFDLLIVGGGSLRLIGYLYKVRLQMVSS